VYHPPPPIPPPHNTPPPQFATAAPVLILTSAPLPSNACLQKSTRMAFCAPSQLPYVALM
jgi:hypothetical protein